MDEWVISYSINLRTVFNWKISTVFCCCDFIEKMKFIDAL